MTRKNFQIFTHLVEQKPTKPKPKPTTVPKTTVPITTHTTEPATDEIEED